MNFKKLIFSLVSATFFFGNLIGTTHAETMQKILAQPDLFEKVPKSDFTTFLSEEMKHLPKGPYVIEYKHNLDSLVFWCFCGFCYVRHGCQKYIDSVIEHRNYAQLENDFRFFKSELTRIIDSLKSRFGVAISESEFKKLYADIMHRRSIVHKEFMRNGLLYAERSKSPLTIRQDMMKKSKRSDRPRSSVPDVDIFDFDALEDD